MGKGLESYNFVATPTPTTDNPSAMWSNYTGCKRLIYYDGSVYPGGVSKNRKHFEPAVMSMIYF